MSDCCLAQSELFVSCIWREQESELFVSCGENKIHVDETIIMSVLTRSAHLVAVVKCYLTETTDCGSPRSHSMSDSCLLYDNYMLLMSIFNQVEILDLRNRTYSLKQRRPLVVRDELNIQLAHRIG